MGLLDHVHPPGSVDLVGTKVTADAVVEYFRGRSRQGAQARLLQEAELLGDAASGGRRALVNLERREGVDVELGERGLTAAVSST